MKDFPQGIPKKIHYIWFGRHEQSGLEKECFERLKQMTPGIEIIKWDEDNFDVFSHPYMKKAYEERKLAFVSDYARLKILYEEGGVYLDTDMFLVKDINSLFDGSAFIGLEDEKHINAAIVGAPARDPFIRDVLLKYDTLTTRIPIPLVLTQVYHSGSYDIKVYPKNYFYPFNQEKISQFTGTNAPNESYMVHMWNYSWGHPVLRFLKKYPLYKKMVKLLGSLGIKKFIKKIIGIE